MQFADPLRQTALQAWRARPQVDERAKADNVWFEQRVDPRRQQAFEAGAPPDASPVNLKRAIIDHVQDRVEVNRGVPETFADANGSAAYYVLDEAQEIIRLESLARPLKAQGKTFADLHAAWERKDSAFLDGFLQAWNDARFDRPAFAAFRSEFSGDLASPDWPRRLRDRMGLTHYRYEGGNEPVALMSYSVHTVLTAAANAGAAFGFAVPTVLDAPPNPQFFPSPPGLPCGRAMPLTDDHDETALIAEVLHFRIAYRPQHILDLGVIDGPPLPTDLHRLRNHHLLVLRIAAGDLGYGEEMAP